MVSCLETTKGVTIHMINHDELGAAPEPLGWIYMATATAYFALVTNITLTFVALSTSNSAHRFKNFTHISIYHVGCQQTQSLTAGLHWFVNVLSTATLAASSYTMQWLGSLS